MGLGDILSSLKLGQQIRAEIKQPGFSLKVMAVKAARTVGWYLLGLVGLALATALMDTAAIKLALHNAGLSDAFAVVISGGLLWIGKSIANTLQNSKSVQSPIDGAPVNVQAAEKSGPVLSTQEQMKAFMDRYNALINEGKSFETARTLALQMVAPGLDLKK